MALDNQMLIIPSSTSVGVDQCQSVTIVGDNIRESDEMFQVLVTPADSDDTVAGSSTFNITINSEPGDGMPCSTVPSNCEPRNSMPCCTSLSGHYNK